METLLNYDEDRDAWDSDRRHGNVPISIHFYRHTDQDQWGPEKPGIDLTGGKGQLEPRMSSPPLMPISGVRRGFPYSKTFRYFSQKDSELNKLYTDLDGSKKFLHSESHDKTVMTRQSSLSPSTSPPPQRQLTLPSGSPKAPRSPVESPEEKKLLSSPRKINRHRVHSLKKILLDRALNVENLQIGEYQKINLQASDEISLPAVKTFSWHSGLADGTVICPYGHDDDPNDIFKYHQRRQAVFKILMACPNLEVIEDFNFDTDYDLVLASGKIGAVQRLCIFDTVDTNHLLDFVDAKPKVRVLQLVSTGADLYPEETRRLSWVIKQLFLTCKDSLRVLDLSQFCSTIDLQIPCPLPKVEQLTIGGTSAPSSSSSTETKNGGPTRCLPRRIWLEEVFPNLSILDCSRLQCDDDANWEKYFPTFYPPSNFHGSFGSVKILVISDQFTHVFMERVQHLLCPNFTSLVVHSDHRHQLGGSSSSLVFMLAKIFQFWRHLKHLELRIEDFPVSQATFSLDSAFTGLTEETCRRLRVFGPEATLFEALDGMRKMEQKRTDMRPSISNLRKLKTLDIVFNHNCLEKWALHPQEYPLHLVSFVSGRFGFSLVPGLKVAILFDHKCPWGKELERKLEVESLSPYVSLRHRHDCQCHRTRGGPRRLDLAYGQEVLDGLGKQMAKITF